MLDGKTIQPIVDSMDEVLNKMPLDGWIEGVEYSALIGLVNMLCEPETMLSHAEAILQGKASIQSYNQATVPANFLEVTKTIVNETVNVNQVSNQRTLALVDAVTANDDKNMGVNDENVYPILPMSKIATKKTAAFF